MDKIKVVVDTNIFINGIFKQDQFAQAIFQLKSANKICFVMNKEMQSELLITFSTILFVDCCIDDDVRYLITQDMHINSISNEIKKQYNIEVLSPFQFYTKYKAKQL